MTYDYFSGDGSFFNAPIKWVEECVEHIDPSGGSTTATTDRNKILVGLNFYGRHIGDFESGQEVEHILGRDVVNKIKHLDLETEFEWDDEAAEHFLIYKEKKSKTESALFYPSLMSIRERLKLATTLRTGISIWEVGQGLDFFYDIF